MEHIFHTQLNGPPLAVTSMLIGKIWLTHIHHVYGHFGTETQPIPMNSWSDINKVPSMVKYRLAHYHYKGQCRKNRFNRPQDCKIHIYGDEW